MYDAEGKGQATLRTLMKWHRNSRGTGIGWVGKGRRTESSVQNGPDAAVQRTSRVGKAAKSTSVTAVKTGHIRALGEGVVVIGDLDLV